MHDPVNTPSESNRMNPMHFGLIILTVLALAVGQVLFKLAAADLRLTLPERWASLLSVKLIVALLVYAVATIMWLLVLNQLPLRIAYPFVGLAFLIVPVLAHYVLAEELPWNSCSAAP